MSKVVLVVVLLLCLIMCSRSRQKIIGGVERSDGYVVSGIVNKAFRALGSVGSCGSNPLNPV